jgi:hypothetical protein
MKSLTVELHIFIFYLVYVITQVLYLILLYTKLKGDENTTWKPDYTGTKKINKILGQFKISVPNNSYQETLIT